MCVGIFKNITTKKIHYNSSRVRDFFFVWASFILCSWYGIQNNGHANIIKKFKEPFELIIMGNKITAKYNLLIGVKDIVELFYKYFFTKFVNIMSRLKNCIVYLKEDCLMNMLLPILIHQEARLHHNPKSVCRTQNVFSMLQNSSFVIMTTIWYILQISRIITNYKEYLNVACVDHIKFKHRISYSRTSPYKWQQTLWRVFFENVMTDMNIFT